MRVLVFPFLYISSIYKKKKDVGERKKRSATLIIIIIIIELVLCLVWTDMIVKRRKMCVGVHVLLEPYARDNYRKKRALKRNTKFSQVSKSASSS